mgnify:CR=1 FL=1
MANDVWPGLQLVSPDPAAGDTEARSRSRSLTDVVSRLRELVSPPKRQLQGELHELVAGTNSTLKFFFFRLLTSIPSYLI